jgi:hypothetical protein
VKKVESNCVEEVEEMVVGLNILNDASDQLVIAGKILEAVAVISEFLETNASVVSESFS